MKIVYMINIPDEQENSESATKSSTLLLLISP